MMRAALRGKATRRINLPQLIFDYRSRLHANQSRLWSGSHYLELTLLKLQKEGVESGRGGVWEKAGARPRDPRAD